jgi:hypothetical protein
MAQLLDEIQWGEPILACTTDSAWEAEIKRRGGTVSEADRRVAPNPWLREMCLCVSTFRPSELPMRLFNIAALVTAQEDACRYCYGANRAFMKILGYPESTTASGCGRCRRRWSRAGGCLNMSARHFQGHFKPIQSMFNAQNKSCAPEVAGRQRQVDRGLSGSIDLRAGGSDEGVLETGAGITGSPT